MKNRRITFRALVLSTISVFAFAITHGQDQQQKAWYFNGKSLNFTDGVTQVESLNVEHTETASAANGVHDNSGDLLFHIIDNAVYDKEGNLMSSVTNSENVDPYLPYDMLQMGSEVNFVNVPGSCSKFYMIYSNIDFHPNIPTYSTQNFQYSVLDMSMNDGLGGIDPTSLDTPISYPMDTYINPRFGMAISKLKTNNTRNMYVGGGGFGYPPYDQVYRTVIDGNGVGTPTLLYETDYVSGTTELELSPDESMLAISTARFWDNAASHNTDVLILHLNPDGTLNESLGTDGATSISIPTGQSDRPFTGLEFSEDNNSLFIGALNYGVFEYDLVGSQAYFITDSDNMGNSQLERGYDGLIYAATSSSTMDAIDPGNNNFVYSDHVDFESDAIIKNHHSSAGLTYLYPDEFDIWTLPDQIDGQVYDFDFAEESCFCCELYSGQEVESYLADVTEVWEPGTGSNPFTENETVRVSEELRIASGTSVTIKDMRFEFSENARVVVEPGAYLKLDNTVFSSNECDCGMWLGVEVHGNPNTSQLPFSNQGYLRMVNNSIIENAYVGVMLASRDGETNSPFAQEGDDYSDLLTSFGGIVRANDSRFRNNQRDLLAPNYIWYNLGDELNNLSRFDNCDFLTDELLNVPEANPEYHVELHRVRGITLANCSFRNTASFSEIPILNRGMGIYSVNSVFKVSGSNEPYETAHDLLPISDNVHQSFYRLRYGAKIVGQPNHHFSVSKMEFQDNKTGIYVLGASYETITLNNFKVPEIDDNYPGFNYGAHLINSYLFTIEENDFFGGPELTRIAGLVIDNSCPDDAEDDKNILLENEVYRNQFTDLEIGILVENDNRDQNSEVGLQARCNQFSNNYASDIHLADYSEWRKNQGELSPPEAASNNLFSQSTFNCAGLYSDVKVSPLYGANQSPNTLTIDYRTLETPAATQPYKHYQNPLSGCQEQKLWLVESPGNLDYETHCPSNFTTGGGIKVPKAELVQNLATAEANLASAKAVYQATIDGGDSEDIIALLQNLLNEESAYLRDLLLASYPLSRKALMAALDAADSFDPWHLTQVLVANAPLPGDVYSLVKDNQVLSPFFFQFVEDAQANGGVNLGRLLYSEISLRSYEKSQAERGIHRHYLHHSDSLDAAAWNTYVESRDDPYYRLYRLGAHLDKGETGAAQTMLDSLKLNVDSKDWFQFMIDLEVADTVTAADINSGWDFFYNAPATRGNVWGWLTAQGQLDSIPPLPPIAQPKSFSLMSYDEAAQVDRWLEAYPNPAKDRVVLTYPHEADGIGTVQLFNADGRLMKTFAASDSGFEEINLTGWPTGVYIAKLFVNDKPIDTVKITVVK